MIYVYYSKLDEMMKHYQALSENSFTRFLQQKDLQLEERILAAIEDLPVEDIKPTTDDVFYALYGMTLIKKRLKGSRIKKVKEEVTVIFRQNRIQVCGCPIKQFLSRIVKLELPVLNYLAYQKGMHKFLNLSPGKETFKIPVSTLNYCLIPPEEVGGLWINILRTEDIHYGEQKSTEIHMDNQLHFIISVQQRTLEPLWKNGYIAAFAVQYEFGRKRHKLSQQSLAQFIGTQRRPFNEKSLDSIRPEQWTSENWRLTFSCVKAPILEFVRINLGKKYAEILASKVFRHFNYERRKEKADN